MSELVSSRMTVTYFLQRGVKEDVSDSLALRNVKTYNLFMLHVGRTMGLTIKAMRDLQTESDTRHLHD
jgi:hypothetical protein